MEEFIPLITSAEKLEAGLTAKPVGEVLVLKVNEEINMSCPTQALNETDSLPRVSIERRIFVGNDKEAFRLWLKTLAGAYPHGRIEGYVVDLTGGTLWAVLDLSDISQEVYDDITLRAVEPDDDASASEAFLRLTRSCDPTTAINRLSCSFETAKWPSLTATCSLFIGSGDQPSVVNAGLLDAVKRLEPLRDRRQQLRLVVQRAAEEGASQLRRHYDLVRQAHAEHWPQWAVECLPSLFIVISAPPQGGIRALVWHYLLACLPADDFEIHGNLCGGAVDEASLSPKAMIEIRRVVGVFERHRLENPYPSEKSTIGVIIASRIETGLDSIHAPIGKELKQIVSKLDYEREITDVVGPAMTALPEETWKTSVVKLAKKDRWPAGAIAALRSIERQDVRLNP